MLILLVVITHDIKLYLFNLWTTHVMDLLLLWELYTIIVLIWNWNYRLTCEQKDDSSRIHFFFLNFFFLRNYCVLGEKIIYFYCRCEDSIPMCFQDCKNMFWYPMVSDLTIAKNRFAYEERSILLTAIWPVKTQIPGRKWTCVGEKMLNARLCSFNICRLCVFIFVKCVKQCVSWGMKIDTDLARETRKWTETGAQTEIQVHMD